MSSDLFYRKWEVESPKAALYIVHGLGEHSGRYQHVAGWFNARGVAVYSGDYPGFGRTKGKRGHADSFATILDSIEQGWRNMCAELPQVPHFIPGHSLGGLLVTEFLLSRSSDKQIEGAIITSPGYRAAFEVPAWKNTLAKILTPLFPSLAIPSGLPVDAISRDPEVVREYIADPLVHDKVSLRFYEQMNQQMASIFTRVEQFPLDMPVYWMQAGADRLVDPQAARQFYNLLPEASHRHFKQWEGLYHEILNESEKEEVLQEIWAFLEPLMNRTVTATSE